MSHDPTKHLKNWKRRQLLRNRAPWSLTGTSKFDPEILTPLFSAKEYLLANEDVTEDGAHPLIHYLAFGISEARNPRPLFCLKTYYEALGLTSKAAIASFFGESDPILYYLDNWKSQMVSPCPVLDIQTYLNEIDGNLEGQPDPLTHYLRKGYRYDIKLSSLFDNGFYRNAYRDIVALDVCPAEHFLQYGILEGRAPHEFFDLGFYRNSLVPTQSPKEAFWSYVGEFREQNHITSPNLHNKYWTESLPALGHRTSKKQKVAVGIVLYKNDDNELEVLRESIEAEVANASHEIVVLAHPNDESIERYRSALGGRAILDSFDGNIGFGAGQNQLMRLAFQKYNCDSYIGANPDGFFCGDTIQKLVDFSDYWSAEALIEAIQFPMEHPKFYNPISLDTGWVSGACFLITKNIWSTTGGFDETFPLYCEDVDLSWTAREFGFLTKICPTAKFYHDTIDRTDDMPEQAKMRSEKMLLGMRRLAHKWGSDTVMKRAEAQLHQIASQPLPDLSSYPTKTLTKESPADFDHPRFAPSRFWNE